MHGKKPKMSPQAGKKKMQSTETVADNRYNGVDTLKTLKQVI